MPASIRITRFNQADVRWLLKQMRTLDVELYNQMRRDFRTGIRPIQRDLAANIPTISSLGIAGLSPRAPRSRQSVEDRSPYVYKKPSSTIDVGFNSRGQRRGRYKTEPVLRIRFSDKRPYSAFSILERAKQGRLAKAAITAGHQPNGSGRWVIQQFYDKQGQAFDIAKRILLDYAKKFSLRVAYRMGDLNKR